MFVNNKLNVFKIKQGIYFANDIFGKSTNRLFRIEKSLKSNLIIQVLFVKLEGEA